ncbi:GntR family transcriptional regulator [Burkholderia multivorans]
MIYNRGLNAGISRTSIRRPACRCSDLLPMPRKIQTAAADTREAKPEPPVSAANTVFLGIIRGLERRTFVPGQRLVEADLADYFKVGRNSVREALQRLGAEGIVDLSRHRGAAIRLLTRQEMHDVLEVAELLTGLLARAAARNADRSGHAGRLREVLDELAECDAQGDPDAFGKIRRNFYRALLDIADNRELNRLFPAVQMHILHAQYRTPNLVGMRIADYSSIAEAVLDGNCAEAERAGVAHVRHVRDAIDRIAAESDDAHG